MRLSFLLAILAAMALSAGVSLAQVATAPASRPTTTTAPYMVPDSVKKKIDQQFADGSEDVV